MNYESFLQLISDSAHPFHPHVDSFRQAFAQRLQARPFAEWAQWQSVIDELPAADKLQAHLDQDTVTLTGELAGISATQLQDILMRLHPWRKGPFRLFDVFIDTEWRSDWKWQRLLPHTSDLAGRKVLDVGCGSGYHCWRMRGAGASLVVGIEPMAKFIFQFEVLHHYLPQEPVFVLPMISEELPAKMELFDTVFSMGVLYHRRSPIDHLEELRDALRKGGELVLETLVVDGDVNTVFTPGDRYAQMRNVWFLPSTAALELWLSRTGFTNIRTVDINQTSIEEQRSTDWMTFHSLREFLDPHDINKTVEGYPAPKRAMVIAEKA